MASRTTDLLAVAILLGGALTMGGTLIEWWRADPHEVLPGGEWTESAGNWGADGSPVSLQFGEQAHTLQRQTVRGTAEQATGALIEACRRIVRAEGRPGREFDAAERAMLERLAGAEPVEQAGVWRVYRFEGPHPMVVGTRDFSENRQGGEGTSVPLGGRRVVCWGLALPDNENMWTLFVTHSAAGGGSGGGPEVGLPPGSRRLMGLRDGTGGGLVAFEGAGPAEAWGRFFDEQFAARGWSRPRAWDASPTGWSARFIAADADPPARMDVRFGPSGPEAWTGMISITVSRQ